MFIMRYLLSLIPRICSSERSKLASDMNPQGGREAELGRDRFTFTLRNVDTLRLTG